MKTNLTMLVGLLALGFCLPNALGEEPPAKKKGPPPSKEGILKKWDKNTDGALSKEELAEMPERMSANLLKRGDKDGDGALSKEEVDELKFPEAPKKGKEGDAPEKKEKAPE